MTAPNILFDIEGEREAPKPAPATLFADIVFDRPLETTVELTAHRAESDLTDLDLPDDIEPPAA